MTLVGNAVGTPRGRYIETGDARGIFLVTRVISPFFIKARLEDRGF